MRQKIMCLLFMVSCFLFGSIENVSAQTFKTPAVKNTEQWSVNLVEPILDKSNMTKSKPGVFDVMG